MRTIRTVAEMQEHSRAARANGRRIGLVPTMGAFHGGHESLMRAAREGSDEMVVSLFVNPAQFNDPRDLAAYPRDEQHDAAVAARLGADVLFAPPVETVYPDGFSTTVAVAGLSDVLEGAHRGPGHFAGVCTVVAKLFNMVAPDVAYFGQKDAQQVAVVGRMARDLDLPVQIEVLPTVREPDGLAMSSRNRRLSPRSGREPSRSPRPSPPPRRRSPATAPSPSPPPAPRSPPTTSCPSTSRSSTPTPSGRPPTRAASSWPSPPASATPV